MVALDRGNFGQESDVNRACSAFGLDTVNYRAFPENGPVPPSPQPPSPAAPSPSIATPSPAVSIAAAPIPPSRLDTAALPPAAAPDPIQAAPLPAPAAATAPLPAEAQRQPVAPGPANQAPGAAAAVFQIPQAAPAPYAAPPGYAASPYPAAAYNPPPPVQSGYVPQPAMPPANFGYQPEWAPPPGGPPMPAPGSGLGFSLLAQAVPAANPASPRPMGAFAMASVSLRPISPGWQGAAMPPAAAPAAPAAPAALPGQGQAQPEMFGTAFAAAYNATFGNGRTVTPGSPVPYPQS